MRPALSERYAKGEHEAVWRDLRRTRSLDDAKYAEALAVGRLTMARVAHNAKLLQRRLKALGWKALTGSLLSKPTASDVKAVVALEAFTEARVPPSLKAFWEVVGGIDLVWDYQKDDSPPPLLGVQIPIEEMDPLSVDPARASAYLLEEWRDILDAGEHDPADGWSLDLAPDSLHKANISGGAPYGVKLPFDGADPAFAEEPHALPFVDYLRLCFRFGGFPGLEHFTKQANVRSLVAHLTEGLLDF